jgi:hypothetical protein|tara:strand:- start:1535 stop:1894 length:360 start_codon:yes stop_codon:yes gene_type:complete
MNKCCGSVLIPKIIYKASLMDSIGLVVLLGFFLSILSLVAWLISYPLVSLLFSGTGSMRGHGEVFGFLIFLLIAIGKFSQKVINACSYLVDYKLEVTTRCPKCGNYQSLVSYPKNEDPF